LITHTHSTKDLYLTSCSIFHFPPLFDVSSPRFKSLHFTSLIMTFLKTCSLLSTPAIHVTGGRGGPRSWFGRFGGAKYLSFVPDIEPRSLNRTAITLVTISTELQEASWNRKLSLICAGYRTTISQSYCPYRSYYTDWATRGELKQRPRRHKKVDFCAKLCTRPLRYMVKWWNNSSHS
jgi:hypothetical protein